MYLHTPVSLSKSKVSEVPSAPKENALLSFAVPNNQKYGKQTESAAFEDHLAILASHPHSSVQ